MEKENGTKRRDGVLGRKQAKDERIETLSWMLIQHFVQQSQQITPVSLLPL